MTQILQQYIPNIMMQYILIDDNAIILENATVDESEWGALFAQTAVSKTQPLPECKWPSSFGLLLPTDVVMVAMRN